MSSEHLSRRQFLVGAGAIVGLGLRGRRTEACPRPRRRAGARVSAPSGLRARQEILRVRQDMTSLNEEQLNSLRRGVAAMKALPESDPRSWSFQANIHGTLGSATSPLFNQCEHGTLLFLAWHRGYLYYFERILRQAAGDPSFTLPYWDWTASPILPAAFRTPADPDNPLYDDSRTINDGSALPSEVVVDDLDTALNFVPFPPSGPVGFSRSLEASPHGAVHVLVGGKMSSVPTAANDPIFWLHHCNIDRLWDRWLNQGGGRINPSDPAFLDRQYALADDNGETVTWTVRDIIGSAQLGYRYDNVPNPPPAPVAVKAVIARGPAAEREGARPVRAASTVKDEAPAAASKPLGFKPETVKLHVAAQHAAALKAAAQGARTAKPGKLLLQIEGLSLAEVPNFTYAVYLNLTDDTAPADQAKLHYVGTINFFGKGAAGKQPHGHDAEKTFRQTFDVTGVVARLQEKGRWKPDALSVTLRPLTPIPPKGREEALRKRSEQSAQKAKISYQRINLVVAP